LNNGTVDQLNKTIMKIQSNALLIHCSIFQSPFRSKITNTIWLRTLGSRICEGPRRAYQLPILSRGHKPSLAFKSGHFIEMAPAPSTL